MKTIISTAACDVLAAAPKAIPSANHVKCVNKFCQVTSLLMNLSVVTNLQREPPNPAWQ